MGKAEPHLSVRHDPITTFVFTLLNYKSLMSLSHWHILLPVDRVEQLLNKPSLSNSHICTKSQAIWTSINNQLLHGLIVRGLTYIKLCKKKDITDQGFPQCGVGTLRGIYLFISVYLYILRLNYRRLQYLPVERNPASRKNQRNQSKPRNIYSKKRLLLAAVVKTLCAQVEDKHSFHPTVQVSDQGRL